MDNVTFNIDGKTVVPYSGRELKTSNKLADEGYYQKQLNGTVNLIDNGNQKDFTFIKQLEEDRDSLHIFEIVTDDKDLNYQGEFSINECEIDEDARKAIVKPTTSDTMTYIMKNKDIEVDVLNDYTKFINVKANKYSYLSFYHLFEETLGGGYYSYNDRNFNPPELAFDSDVYHPLIVDFEPLVMRPDLYFPSSKTYVSEIVWININDPIPIGWKKMQQQGDFSLYQRKPSFMTFNMVWLNSFKYNGIDLVAHSNGYSPITGYNDWMQSRDNMITFGNFYEWNVIGSYTYWKKRINIPKIENYTDNPDWIIVLEEIVDAFTSEEDVLIFQNTGVKKTESLSYFIAIKRNLLPNGDKKIDYSNVEYRTQPLRQIFETIRNTAFPDFKGNFKSTFLFNDQIPDSVELYKELSIKTLPIIDPNFIGLCEMSDFIKPNASQAATRKETTFAKILEALNQKLIGLLGYCIDANGDFRIELMPYFMRLEQGYDARSHNLRKVYTYDSGKVPNRIYLEESQTWNTDFTKKAILNGQIPTLDGTNENVVSFNNGYLFSDIDGLNEHLAELSTNGFVIMHSRWDSTNNIFTVTGANAWRVFGEIQQNNYLSASYLLFLYSKYEAYKNSFKLVHEIVDPNDDDSVKLRKEKSLTAKTLKKLKREKITIIADPRVIKGDIMTEVGLGKIASHEYPNLTGKVINTIELLHD